MVTAKLGHRLQLLNVYGSEEQHRVQRCESIGVAVCISHVDVGISDVLSMKGGQQRWVIKSNLYPGLAHCLYSQTNYWSAV